MNLERLLCDAVRLNLAKGGTPKVPAGGELLWKWFGDLCATRASGAFGPNPISWAEIESYRRMTGWPIEERHVRSLLAMDAAFRSHANGEPQSTAVGDIPVTAAVFDAVFG